MFSKILICLDASEGALTTARMGAQIAQNFHSAVLLCAGDALTIRHFQEIQAGREESYEETVVQGIDQAVSAFIGLFEGKNTGKMVVELAPYEETV